MVANLVQCERVHRTISPSFAHQEVVVDDWYVILG